MKIRAARPDEADAITALALRSKAAWPYDAEFLARCRDELTISPAQIGERRAHVAEDHGALLGFFTVVGSPPHGELDALYVEPSAMGAGVGRALLDAARDVARREGFTVLMIHSDPHAEGFYRRHGAARVGAVPSGSIAGRLLPLLRLDVPPEPP